MAAPHRTNTAATARTKNTANALGLADLLNNRKHPTVLLGDIRAHVVEQALKPDPGRNPHVLHPSDICRSTWCPRANIERLRGRVSTPERPSFTRESVFQYGTDRHTRWQDWMAQMRLLEGTWNCRSTGQQFYANAPLTCGICGERDFAYAELVLRSHDLLIEGRTDGYVPERGCLVEIKTVGEGTIRHADPALLERYTLETPRGDTVDLKGLWDAIHKPFLSHLRQGQIYLHLARGMGLPVERMVYIYDSKLTQDAKEFAVSYDKGLISPILAAARKVKLAMDGAGEDPECRFPGECRDCDALT